MIHFIFEELYLELIMDFQRFAPSNNEFFQLMLYAYLKTFLIFSMLHHSFLLISTRIIYQVIAKSFASLDFKEPIIQDIAFQEFNSIILELL